ncbi:MAG: hypothetical protein WAX69_16855, partial [Victivallales bacterium]
HYPVRYLPRNCYESYLKSILVAKNYPIWLEHWKGLDFESAVYDAARQEATVTITAAKTGARLECGAVRLPTGATLDGRILPFEFLPGKNRLIFAPPAAGTLVVAFN